MAQYEFIFDIYNIIFGGFGGFACNRQNCTLQKLYPFKKVLL